LVQILDREFWKIGLDFVSPDDDAVIVNGTTGFLHIGDTCFEMEHQFSHRTDLGAEWKLHTGLPFVFACWTSIVKPDTAFVRELNIAFKTGIEHIEHMNDTDLPNAAMLRDYLKSHISFPYTTDKELGLAKFLDLVTNPSQQFSTRLHAHSFGAKNS
jgi:chorismate dehydratase